MAGYYRKFCKNFSDVTAPLSELLKKGVKDHWSEACHKSFDKVKKNLLCLEPILSALNFSKLLQLTVDTSDMGASALLLQSDDEDIEHPVYYFSKKFNVHGKNYSIVEKECLTLIFVIQHFDIYISSSQNRRLLNWSLMLQECNLEIEHVKGKNNICVDTLSRNCG